MKNILALVVIVSWIASFTSAFSFSGCEEKMFTVTAYYSPETGQIFYYKPSFQDEVILNGEGHIGASGKKVFTWMLAWPKTYPFGSLIYFPEMGVGEIADRGGAIVLSGEKNQKYDRIDIRMGRGEEGLIRALTFGKKNMTGYCCNASIIKQSGKKMLTFDSVPILKYFFDSAIRIQELKPGRKDIRVRTLQKYLVNLWYLNKKHRHGEYNDYTKKALCSYQVARKIVGSKHPDCGTFGKTTRATMKVEVQKKKLLPTDLYAKGNFTTLLDLAQWYNGKPAKSIPETKGNPAQLDKGGSKGGLAVTKTTKIFLFYKAYTKGQQSSEIKILQTFLQSQWFYSWALDGIYSKATTNAVYEFQKKYSLISDSDPLILRGYLGPATRSKMNEMRQK